MFPCKVTEMSNFQQNITEHIFQYETSLNVQSLIAFIIKSFYIVSSPLPGGVSVECVGDDDPSFPTITGILSITVLLCFFLARLVILNLYQPQLLFPESLPLSLVEWNKSG